MNLNLGCGSVKFEGCVNVDSNPNHKPDKCFDIRKSFPLENNIFNEVYLFHIIEHIEKKHWPQLFAEIHRVMATDGVLYISYPEFRRIAQNWLENRNGKKDFWEATIYGRQLYEGDYHVSLMDSNDFKEYLTACGFKEISFRDESSENYNTICKCTKGLIPKTYEQVVYEDIFG